MSPPKKSSPAQAQPPIFTAGTDPLAVGPPVLLKLPAALVGLQPEPPTYEPEVAEKLLTAYQPRLEVIAADRLEFPSVDVDAVTRALLSVYAFTQVEQLLPIYEALAAAGQFDLANLTHLRDLSLILIHVSRRADLAAALKTNAKVSAELDTESLDCEKRMQTVCENFFPDDPVIVALRPGIGYVDRAYDLFGYADHYDKHPAIVAGHVQYRAGDKDLARKLAGRLLADVSKGMNPEQQRAFDRMRRVWTFLKAVYFEAQQVGLAALRYDPQKDARFPSLYAVGRKGAGRRKAGKDEGTASPSEVASPVAKPGNT